MTPIVMLGCFSSFSSTSRILLLCSTNLIIAAGACTAIVTKPLDTTSMRMQPSAVVPLGNPKSLWENFTEGSLSEAI
ncbi:unnamed protein product [Cuscuta campestris]|uniref:Uncharacterized protein n=1 Tax=Cuscuta campestris TaxID=132261 RepID=A0A484NGG3_9ASTE|nr:unnamed protein product [Cuscuta campestris]